MNTTMQSIPRSRMQLMLQTGLKVEIRTAPDTLDEFDAIGEIVRYSLRKHKYQVKIVEHVETVSGGTPPEGCEQGTKVYVPRQDIRLPLRAKDNVFIADPDRRDDVEDRLEKTKEDSRVECLTPRFLGWDAGTIVDVKDNKYYTTLNKDRKTKPIEVDYADVQNVLPEVVKKQIRKGSKDGKNTVNSLDYLLKRYSFSFGAGDSSKENKISPSRQALLHLAQHVTKAGKREIPTDELLSVLWDAGLDKTTKQQDSLDKDAATKTVEFADDTETQEKEQDIAADDDILPPESLPEIKNYKSDFWGALDEDKVSRRTGLLHEDKTVQLSEEEDAALTDMIEPTVKCAFSSLEIFGRLKGRVQNGDDLPLSLLPVLVLSLGIVATNGRIAKAIVAAKLAGTVEEANQYLLGTEKSSMNADDAVDIVQELILTSRINAILETRFRLLLQGCSACRGLVSLIGSVYAPNNSKSEESKISYSHATLAALSSFGDIDSALQQCVNTFQTSSKIDEKLPFSTFSEGGDFIGKEEFQTILADCQMLDLTNAEAEALANEPQWCDDSGTINVNAFLDYVEEALCDVTEMDDVNETLKRCLIKFRAGLLGSTLCVATDKKSSDAAPINVGPSLWLLIAAVLPGKTTISLLSPLACNPRSSLSHQLFPRIAGDPLFSSLTGVFFSPEGQPTKEVVLGEGYGGMSGKLFGVGIDGAGIKQRLCDVLPSTTTEYGGWLQTVSEEAHNLLGNSSKVGLESPGGLRSQQAITKVDQKSMPTVSQLLKVETYIIELATAKQLPSMDSKLRPAITSRQVRLTLTDQGNGVGIPASRRIISNQHICTASVDQDHDTKTETWYFREKSLIKALEHCNYASLYFDEASQEEMKDFKLPGSAETSGGTFVIRSSPAVSNLTNPDEETEQQEVYIEFVVTVNVAELINCLELEIENRSEKSSEYQDLLDKFESRLASDKVQTCLGEVDFAISTAIVPLSSLHEAEIIEGKKKQKSTNKVRVK